MPRKKKDYANVGIKMAKTVSDKLDKYCEESGMSKTAVIERAVNRYIDADKEYVVSSEGKIT